MDWWCGVDGRRAVALWYAAVVGGVRLVAGHPLPPPARSLFPRFPRALPVRPPPPVPPAGLDTVPPWRAPPPRRRACGRRRAAGPGGRRCNVSRRRFSTKRGGWGQRQRVWLPTGPRVGSRARVVMRMNVLPTRDARRTPCPPPTLPPAVSPPKPSPPLTPRCRPDHPQSPPSTALPSHPAPASHLCTLLSVTKTRLVATLARAAAAAKTAHSQGTTSTGRRWAPATGGTGASCPSV